jgi:TrmH family RNA methyltransferase
LITSHRNPKLTLARALRERRRREREGLFVTEGEDLLVAGRLAGVDPVALLSTARSGLGGQEVEPGALAAASALGSGTRVLAIWRLPEPRAPGPGARICVYLHGVGDPGNVGAIIRSADALAGATVVLGPDCADPYGPRALRSTMGSIFARPPARAEVSETPEPRAALVAHGGRPLPAGIEALLAAAVDSTRDRGAEAHGAGLAARLTLCLGAERDGLPASVLQHCEHELTIALRRGGAESLNVAAAAAIALHRISSAAFGGKPMESPSEQGRGSRRVGAAPAASGEGVTDG